MKRDIVLCVDDEPAVVRLCTIAAACAGLRAVVAENGTAGLETFLRLREEICLVISDVVMPISNGVEMVQRILKFEPDMKVLFISGYTDEVLESEVRDRHPFLRKPFILAVLINRIQSL